MNFTQVRSELDKAGTAQNRKIYGRHGVTAPMYGVSYAVMNKVAKKIGTDHDLAERLWATGNHDLRVLATRVADPERLSSGQLDAWAKELSDYVATDAFSSMVARSPWAQKKAEKWMRSKSEFTSAAGYNVLASLAMADNDLPAAWFGEHLKTIEAEIHGRPNRTRHSMNQALICIGTRTAGLKRRAVAAAKRIGKVEVDHGQTSCKTPAAAPYIEKAFAHRQKKAAKKAAAARVPR